MADAKRVILGRIGKVHGIKGWLRLQAYTESPEALLGYRHFQAEKPDAKDSTSSQGTADSQNRPLEMDDCRQQTGGVLLAHFKGYDAPEMARALSGLELTVAADALPPLQAGTYYWHQLQELRVVNRQGQDFGSVVRLLETGANDVLVVQPDAHSIDSRQRLIPYLPGRAVTKVDLASGTITVDWQADYLS